MLRGRTRLHLHPVEILPIARSHSRTAVRHRNRYLVFRGPAAKQQRQPAMSRRAKHVPSSWVRCLICLCLCLSLLSQCILAELYTGYPLFPGENETEQIACIMEIMGPPPKRLVQECTRKKAFFDATGKPLVVPNSRGKIRQPGSKDLAMATKCSDAAFLSFLRRCLRWDPKVRMTPEKAFEHPWITEGIAPPRPKDAGTPISQAGFVPSASVSVSMQGQQSSRGEKIQAKVAAAGASSSTGDSSARQSASIAVAPALGAVALTASPPAADVPMTDSPSSVSSRKLAVNAKVGAPTTARRPSLSASTSAAAPAATKVSFPPIAAANAKTATAAAGNGQTSSRQYAADNTPMDTQ